MKKPLVAVALLYGAGLLLAHFVEAPLVAAFIAAFVITFVALWWDRLRTLLLPACLFFLGWINMTARTAILSPYDLRVLLPNRAELVSLRGRIIESPSQRISLRNGVESSHTLAAIEVGALRMEKGEWRPAVGQIMSRTPGVLPAELTEGQTVDITGVSLQPPPPVAEGVFDYARYLKLRGIYYELRVDRPADWKIFGSAARRPIGERFRTWGQSVLARGLPEQDESLRLQWAMLLGWQTALTSEVSEPFMRSGTMHIFAISGLHIALIAGIFLVVLRATTLPRLACGFLVIPIIWFYTAATGWQASAIRSTVMMTVIIFGWSLKRPSNLLNSLAMAACVILVWQPEQLFQAGFQLSFFVVLSIALLSPAIEKGRQKLFTLDPLLPFDLRPWWQRTSVQIAGTIWKCFATSLAAFIGSIPLIAYYFHLFTPGSLLANLIVVPISSLALMSGVGALLTGDLVPFMTEWFNNSGWFWMRTMIWLSETAANAPAAWCHVREPGFCFFILYYGLIIAACAGWFVKKQFRWVVVSSATVLAAALILGWREKRTWHRLTVLPLSGGHATYLEPARGGPDWMINTGDNGAFLFTLKPFLQARGVDRVNHLLLTHGDVRLMGAAPKLNEVFRVRETLISPIAFRSAKYRDVISELDTVVRVRRIATNGLIMPPWSLLHPNASDHFAAAEDKAVVALGNFDGTRVLLVPALGKDGQNAVFTRHPELRADIVIAGLPDKGEPLAIGWIESIAPKLIIIVDSEHPAARRAPRSLLGRLRPTGARVLNTRDTGAIALFFRSGSWRLEIAQPFTAIESIPETDAPDARDE